MKDKRTFLLLALLLFINRISVGQQHQKSADTVYLSRNVTTSIIVPGQITTIDVGKANFAKTQVYKNSLFLKPEHYPKHNDETSLIIQFLKKDKQIEYYSALLKYTDKKGIKFHYDKRDAFGKPKVDIAELKKQKQQEYINRVKRKISLLDNESVDIKDVGDFKENIIMLLRVIRIDERNMYLSFEVQNNSTLDFHIANIDLSYVKKLKKGLFKKSELQREPVGMILGDNPVKTIYGGQSQKISFALPMYGLKSKDYLQVMFREYSGNRNLEFKVYGKTITKYAKYLLLEEEQYIKDEQKKLKQY